MTGYTKFDNPLLEKILTSGFTKRQIKILLLILRFSSGCHKTYAVLRRNDFAYAGISQYCITEELKKLVKLRVIRWDTARDLVWINPDLNEWAVDKTGEKSGDHLRRFFKVASKNLLKWQLSVYQNSKQEVAETARISTGNKEKKEIVKKYYCGESTFLRVLGYYFLNVSPLKKEEVSILREVTFRHGNDPVEKAICLMAGGNKRSFSRFLKMLEDVVANAEFRHQGLRSIRADIQRRRKPASP